MRRHAPVPAQSRLLGRGSPTVRLSPGTEKGSSRYVLAPDHIYGPLAREIARRIREGESATVIARDLNGRALLTWHDYLRQRRHARQRKNHEELTGLPVQGHAWHAGTILEIVRHPAMAGFLVYEGEIHTLPNGEWAMITEYPHLTYAEWQATMAALRPGTPRPKAGITYAVYASIARCRGCAGPMYHQKFTKTRKTDGVTNLFRHYRCHASSQARVCDARAPSRPTSWRSS